nr:MAG TPA: hypothetical protein [Caudoviricetes sp.]
MKCKNFTLFLRRIPTLFNFAGEKFCQVRF